MIESVAPLSAAAAPDRGGWRWRCPDPLRAHPRMGGHRITVCRRDELTPGGARRFDVKGVAVAVVRIDDEVYAIGDRCTQGVALRGRGG
jgi:hypothetical protein